MQLGQLCNAANAAGYRPYQQVQVIDNNETDVSGLQRRVECCVVDAGNVYVQLCAKFGNEVGSVAAAAIQNDRLVLLRLGDLAEKTIFTNTAFTNNSDRSPGPRIDAFSKLASFQRRVLGECIVTLDERCALFSR